MCCKGFDVVDIVATFLLKKTLLVAHRELERLCLFDVLRLSLHVRFDNLL
jgi:hypothetical protein